ncbi:MAG: glycosyltransferase family 2 protein, partial [Gammaproteobacteria bacterium]
MNIHDIKISAVLPNYNMANFLPKAIQTLVDQTEKFFEIIIIDDASTDDSLKIIYDFMQRYDNIQLIKHEKNLGVNPGLNHGIEQSAADYILFCAADDWYHPHIVTLAKAAIKKCPSVKLICGDAVVYFYDKKAPFHRMLSFPQKNTYISPAEFRSIISHHYIGFNGGSIIANRQAVMDAKMLQPSLRWHADWLLQFVLALKHGLYYIDHVFAYVDLREESYCEGRHNMMQQKQVLIAMIDTLQTRYPELWQDFKKYGLMPNYSSRFLSWFLFNANLRRYVSVRLLWR